MATRHSAARVEQRRLKIGLASIAYQVAGSGEPLILIHGLSGSSRWWDRNVEILAQHFRVYVVDLIGFGASRAKHPFVLKDAAAYLAAWMARLGIGRAHVVGHSMGAVIAADLAADFPHCVDRLILVAAAVFVTEQDPLAHALGVIQEFGLHQPGFLPILLGDAFRAGLGTVAKAAAELLSTDITAKLRQIKAPALVVWGEHDSITPLDAGERLHHALPNSQLAVIEGVGHNPMWESPIAFNHVVTRFIEQTASLQVGYSTVESAADQPTHGRGRLSGATG